MGSNPTPSATSSSCSAAFPAALGGALAPHPNLQRRLDLGDQFFREIELYIPKSADCFDSLEQIVRDGAYLGLGMPRFEWFSDAEIDSLRAYILTQRAALIESLATQ